MRKLSISIIILAIMGIETAIAQPTQRELLNQSEIKFVNTGPLHKHATPR